MDRRQFLAWAAGGAASSLGWAREGLRPEASLPPPPEAIARYFRPPPEYADDFGPYRSVLRFDDGTPVRTAADWAKRREEIRRYWWRLLGEPPPRLERPRLEFLDRQVKDGYTQHHVRIETAPDRRTDDAYLLVPEGKGPFPAAIVVFYDGKTGIGEGKGPHRDFARQLTRNGLVTLSLGGSPYTYYPSPERCRIQPLAFHAYEAANCHRALSQLDNVDAARIGIVGHSYGGKWAMFAACLYDEFACGAWSDPGVVFDESRPNVNYWEPWYLGFEPGRAEQRRRGVPSASNPRTGPYKQLVAEGRDLHELHVLMAPRPFLVSGGSEDPPERWKALNHSIAVNRLLGCEHRVAMTNRPSHDPTPESNAVLCQFFVWALRAGR